MTTIFSTINLDISFSCNSVGEVGSLAFAMFDPRIPNVVNVVRFDLVRVGSRVGPLEWG